MSRSRDPQRSFVRGRQGVGDTAANIVTYVPGTYAKLDKDISIDIERADRMAAAANRADPTRATVGILWLGYDAPQSVLPDASDERYARGAEADLGRFTDGLRVTHDGPPSHNTVIGHSYGSTVVGFTARDGQLNADDVIFVGSPGVGVDHADQLGLPGDHVWASTAEHDPIQDASLRQTGIYDPIGIGVHPASRDELIFGKDPNSPAFGAHHFHSDPGDLTPFAQAHSEYWDKNSASLNNIGPIVGSRAA